MNNLKVLVVPESGFSANCYIIYSEYSKKGLIIDPACPLEVIEKNIGDKGIVLEKIVLTHGHSDHIATVEELRNKYSIPVLVHKDDEPMLEDGALNFSTQMFRSPIEFKADEFMAHGDRVSLEDGFEFEVIHTPGHTPGGVCLKFGDILVTGDTLFQGSIGRTDFPGGNFADIIESIKTKLLSLDGDTIILPGHGPHSTIANERDYNPFLR